VGALLGLEHGELMRHRLITVSSAKAFRDGIWPRKGWGVIDRQDGELLGEFQTRREAVEWRDKEEKEGGWLDMGPISRQN
jgi:hypothetical protein